jgi:DNA-directed RNA polymerase subunit RPC12/RpoP
VTTRGPKRTVVTCPTCGSKRIIRLTFDQAELMPPDERPYLKCVGCGERIFQTTALTARWA